MRCSSHLLLRLIGVPAERSPSGLQKDILREGLAFRQASLVILGRERERGEEEEERG